MLEIMSDTQDGKYCPNQRTYHPEEENGETLSHSDPPGYGQAGVVEIEGKERGLLRPEGEQL